MITENDHEEFVGVEEIMKEHHTSYLNFVKWAQEGQWHQFHKSHFDWWMFPIDKESGFAFKYTVYRDEVDDLKQNADFIAEYLHGVELLSLAWGWDINNACYISHPQKEQSWPEKEENSPVRLYKVILSLRLFGYPDKADSLSNFAKDLIEQGKSMEYEGEDFYKRLRGGY